MIRQIYFGTALLMLPDLITGLTHHMLPKNALTTLAGFLANIENKAIKNHLIQYFIRKYHINMAEALEENPEHYANFNAFFIRHLKPACRPIADIDIVSPVDGYVSEIGRIHSGKLLQAKGRDYSVHELLAHDTQMSAQFQNGLFATLYLSPQDYHRVHMPIDATLREMVYVPGQLFSVQPKTTRSIKNLFARNERLAVFFDTNIGSMAMVLVGATIVGAIGTEWHGDIARSKKPCRFTYLEKAIHLQKAKEMGYFKLGSTVILLFADGERAQWEKSLQSGDKIRLGQGIARVC